MVLGHVMDSVLQNVIEYCSKEDTRRRLESNLLSPMMRYMAHKFSWSVRLFQAIAVLVFIQTLILLWLLFREMRRPPVTFAAL
jgi:hypothetical protein